MASRDVHPVILQLRISEVIQVCVEQLFLASLLCGSADALHNVHSVDVAVSTDGSSESVDSARYFPFTETRCECIRERAISASVSNSQARVILDSWQGFMN